MAERRRATAEKKRVKAFLDGSFDDEVETLKKLTKEVLRQCDEDGIDTGGLETCCCGFSAISQFLERILMEHIGMKNSLESELQICSSLKNEISKRKTAATYFQPL